MVTLTSARQIVSRDTLQQIFPNVPSQLLDLLLRSINIDLQSPLRVDASASPNLSVSVGPAIVNNAISGRQKSIPFINSLIPSFSSGAVTFPASDGGLITVSPGSNLTLNCPANQFNKILFSLDSSGNLILTEGTPNAVEASVAVPSPVANALPICYISLSNVAGTIQPIAQNHIFQFAGGGGSGGASQTGYAAEVPISLGATSVTVTFATPLSGINYTVFANFANYIDIAPEFQSIVISQKTINGFVATFNAPTDSVNYLLDYIVPAIQLVTGEIPLTQGATTVTVTLPIPQGGTNYSVVANFVNLIDASPQFQPICVVSKTANSFTLLFNSGTDSNNYRISYDLASYQ
jgi:hypothetical protein